MTAAVIVDVAGGPTGGAARYRLELYRHLSRTGREDVEIIGADRRVTPSWLLRREVTCPRRARRISLTNVSFVAPGGERWTKLGNALHFLTDSELAQLDPSLRLTTQRRAAVVHRAARRSDVLYTPSTAMAERVARVLPTLRSRIIPRLNAVSPDLIPSLPRDPVILCPVLFDPHKHMVERITELLTAVDEVADPSVQLIVTADRAEVPTELANQKRIELVGRLPHAKLRDVWARSRAIYFPTGIESFGFPLAEARVSGHPVIARDTAQNREIAGPALCGFTPGDITSLQAAAMLALSTDVAPDPSPFDPDAYFAWLLGPPR
jgi:glycosyltransferase involved in cell wall biosynthesis